MPLSAHPDFEDHTQKADLTSAASWPAASATSPLGGHLLL